MLKTWSRHIHSESNIEPPATGLVRHELFVVLNLLHLYLKHR